MNYSDAKPWYDIDEAMTVDAALGQELQDLYVAYEQKVRSFKEAREAVHQKGKSRGFFPISKGGMKGKHKMNGKGKKGTAFSVHQSSPGKGKGYSNPSSKPGYTGCFICGDKNHDYRSCPKRGQSSQGSTSLANKSRPIHYVSTSSSSCAYMVEDEPVAPTISQSDLHRLVLTAGEVDPACDRLRYAVLDTGATETVGSLEAIEKIMLFRQEKFGQERVGINPHKQKCFKFGNAQERRSESYLLLPQTCQGQEFSLGIFTLDVPGVPVLLGVRTMKKLGTMIDIEKGELIFKKVFPEIRIPLVRGKNGHLLLDLCSDWAIGSGKSNCDSSQTETLEAPKENAEPENQGVGCQNNGKFEVHVVGESGGESSDAESHHATVELPELSDIDRSLEAQARNNPASPVSQARDGPFSGHTEDRLGGGAAGGDCKACGGGSPGEQEKGGQEVPVQGHGHDQIRLVQGGVCGWPGRTGSQGAMPGEPCSSGFRPRELQRCKPPWPMADLREVPTTSPLRSDSWSKGHLPVSRTTGPRCRSPPAEVHGQWTVIPPARDQAVGARRGRRFGTPPCGADSPGEGSNGEGKGINVRGFGDHSCCQSSSKEGGQEVQRCASRDPGGSQPSDRSPRRRVVQGLDNAHSLSDLPKIEDDALGQDVFPADAGSDMNMSCARTLSEEQKGAICEQLEAAHEDWVHAILETSGSVCDLLEVCCGKDSGLSSRVLEAGGIAHRIGLDNGMDLSTEHGFQKASRFAEEVKPRYMWISTPCGPNSPIQNMNQKTPEQWKRLLDKRKKSKKINSRAIRLAKEQVERGGHVVWEWPTNNLGWNSLEVRVFFENPAKQGLLHKVHLDGCQVGVVSPDTGEPMKKPWTIKTTCPHIATVFMIMNMPCV